MAAWYAARGGTRLGPCRRPREREVSGAENALDGNAWFLEDDDDSGLDISGMGEEKEEQDDSGLDDSGIEEQQKDIGRLQRS